MENRKEEVEVVVVVVVVVVEEEEVVVVEEEVVVEEVLVVVGLMLAVHYMSNNENYLIVGNELHSYLDRKIDLIIQDQGRNNNKYFQSYSGCIHILLLKQFSCNCVNYQ